ncbi:MAG: hypothetical protein AAFQ65_07445 [Myxococcota bacterium]
MSADYTVYSPLPPSTILSVLEECRRKIEEWSEAREGYDDPYGHLSISSHLPDEEWLEEMETIDEELSFDEGEDEAAREQRRIKRERVSQRVPSLKGGININRPADFEISPTQVSIMRFLLANLGDGVVAMVDWLYVTEDIVAELTPMESVEDWLENNR